MTDLVNDIETMSCTGVQACPDSAQTTKSNQTCTWKRKLCVTCTSRDGDIYINVQSNGLPNHCQTTQINIPIDIIQYAWTSVFNPDVTGIENFSSNEINTTTEVDEILCDI